MNQRYDPWWSFENEDGVVKLSYWSLSNYLQCPAKYYYQSQIQPGVKQLTDKRNAVVGSIEHSIFEDFFKSGDRTPTDFQEEVDPTLERFLRHEHVEWKDEYDKPNVVTEIKTDLVTAYDLFAREGLISDYAYPEISLEGYLTPRILLRGRIDLYVEPPEASATVVDHKAVVKETNLDKKQLTFYKILIRCAGRTEPERLGWHLTKHDRIKWAKITQTDEDRLLKDIHEVVEGIRSESFPHKVNKVTCQWCDFRQECPAFNRQFPNQHLFDKVKKIRDTGVVEF